MRKIVIYRWSAPTRRQREYLAVLARRNGVEEPRPRTRGEASAQIDALKRRRPLPSQASRTGFLRTMRALLRRLHGLPREPGAGVGR